MKRPYKEYKLDITDKINLSCCTLNSQLPQVVFVKGKCWITPTEFFNYEEIINEKIYSFKNKLKNKIQLNKSFENKFIFDFDMKYNTFKLNKKHFIDFEIFFKQKKENILSLKELKKQFEENLLGNEINEFITNLEELKLIIQKGK